MKIYKWKGIVLKACQALSSQFHSHNQGIYGLLLQIEQHQTGQKLKTWRENGKTLREKAWAICENWDIRQAGKLLELFPSIIAKKYQGRDFTCDMDEKGNWCLCFE